MRGWQRLIGPLAISVVCAVVLVETYASAVDIPAGVGLVVALALLARGALRLAGNPAQLDREHPPPHA